jgi:hypothetical protein
MIHLRLLIPDTLDHLPETPNLTGSACAVNTGFVEGRGYLHIAPVSEP